MKLSYWDKSILQKPCDVLIIGAGLVGLSSAISLKKRIPSMSIEILEKQSYGALASSRNAGFACFGSLSEIYADIAKYGEEQTIALLQKRRRGIRNLIDKFGSHNLQYKNYGGYEVFAQADDYDLQNSRIQEVNKWIGSDIFQATSTPEGIKLYPMAILNREEGQLHTGRLYNLLRTEALQLGITITRSAEVMKVYSDQNTVTFKIEPYTDHLEKKAAKVLLCTNAITKVLLKEEDIIPVRNQVIITHPIEGLAWKGCFHQDEGYIYFRNVDDRILIGGARHRFPDEEIGILGSNYANLNFLLDHVSEFLAPHNVSVSIDQSWSGILSGGNDRMPIVKRIHENMVVAARLSGMGVAIGMDIGEEAATLLLS